MFTGGTFLRNYFLRGKIIIANCFINNHLCKRVYSSIYLFRKVDFRGRDICRKITTQSPLNEDDIKSPLELFDDVDEKENLIPRGLRVGNMPHQVLILHPYIKWGRKKRFDTTPELELEEAAALIETLKGWQVVDTKKVSLLSFDRHTLFKSGQLETIADVVKQNELITSVFINIKSLKLGQHLFLENVFSLPVFDRHSIVLNIFKRNAITKVAKLQVALAEIPYIRSRIRGVNDIENDSISKNVGIGSNDSHLKNRLSQLMVHEQKLKKSIAKLKQNREVIRQRRKQLELPLVAVVGYTNAGKTSLIKCLTEEDKMLPENKLFATLDVTVHAGVLPCNLKVLYIDTIGFISDIPTNLLEPFVVTLEDAVQADLIIHVEDVSHPNHLNQKVHVLNTLNEMNLSETLKKSIISIGNKCDKLLKPQDPEEALLLVSCTKQTGLESVELAVEKALIKNLQLIQRRIRIRSGSEEYKWLVKEAAVSNYILDETDNLHVYLDVTISKTKLEQFINYFIKT